MIVNVLKAELIKLRKSKSLQVMAVVLFIIILLTAMYADKTIPFAYKDIMGYGYFAPFLSPYMFFVFELLVFGVFTAISTGTDFKNKTIQGVVARGIRRYQYFFGKIIFIMIITGITHFFCIGIFSVYRICAVGFGIKSQFMSGYFIKLTVYTIVTLLQLWAYIAWFVMWSFLCRREAVACGVSILTVYLDGILGQWMVARGFQIFLYTPQRIVYSLIDEYVQTDRILSMEFISNMIPALMIMTVTLACGLLFFEKSDLQ